MTQEHPPLTVKVQGELACFTRPEMKVERVSYPMMTPTAAKGVLEAIYWKPEFTWQVEEIQVLEPIRFTSVVRNEIGSRQTAQTARRWQREGGGFDAADSRNRAQRHTLALRDVAYIIKAQVVVKNDSEDPAKHRDQFRRRVNSGRCFATPYLGCREFWAKFSAPDGTETPIPLTEDLGSMLLCLTYDPQSNGAATPRFFSARLDQGVLRIPHQSGQGG